MKTKRARRILIYSYAFPPSIGGMEQVAAMLARRFTESGCDVTVVTETKSLEFDSANYPILRRPSQLELWSMCRNQDAILSFPLSLKRILPQLLSGCKVVVHHPNIYVGSDGRRRVVDRIKLAACKLVTNVVPSQYMAQEFGGDAIVLPNPYDDHVFPIEDAAPNSDVIFVGRLTKVKGVDVLLRAISSAASCLPHIRLTIVGDGPQRPALQSLASELGIESRVTFRGFIQGIELAAMMRNHGIMVVPSTYKEPFGIVALEGLASGCSLIVSRAGGLADAAGAHALTFPNGDAAELASCLCELTTNPARRILLRSGLETHLALHKESVVAARYMALLFPDQVD